jgi:hypothetical protein
MFTSNPWADYFTILAPLIAGYYLFVGIRFYRKDLKARLTAGTSGRDAPPYLPEQDFDAPDPPERDLKSQPDQSARQNKSPEKAIAEDENTPSASWQNEELFDQVELLATHLKDAIEEAHEKEYGKQDLILLLQMTLKEYPAMSAKPFRTAIDNLIETECAKYGPIHLREEDKAAIWKQV